MAEGRRRRARTEQGTVSRAQLGASLRACVEAARALGDENCWRPASGSASARSWIASGSDAVHRTVTEADVQAITLLHSGLEHASAVGQLLSAGRIFLPHTVARTATEHLLRAQYLLDPEVAPPERVRRRLNEWLYAITESEHRRQGLLSNLSGLEGVEPGDLGRTKDDLITEVADRAAAVGMEVVTSGKNPRVDGTTGRPSTMRLAEEYTAGGATGIPSFTLRGYSAFVHGTEIGLLSGFSDDAPADASLGGVIVPQPAPVDVGTSAFAMMSVLLCTLNAMDAARARLAWTASARLEQRLDTVRDRAIGFWSAAASNDQAG